MRLTVAATLVVGLSIPFVACSKSSKQEMAHRIGQRVQVGPLIYTVVDAEWQTELGELIKPRIPQHKFLLVRLSLTNSGGQEVTVPFLSLEDEQGNSFVELSDAEGVQEWLGLLRPLSPAATEQGRILFDVPPKDYRLRVTDAGEPDRERTALIEIPLRLAEQAPVMPAR